MPQPRSSSIDTPLAQEESTLRPGTCKDHLRLRLARWRDEQMALRALKVAGQPNLILDLPCGDGRFWPLLAEHPNRLILAGDQNAEWLAASHANHSPDVARRVRTFQATPFAIELGENAVDCIFCMRYLQRVETADQRLELLREFHRVTRDTLIVSLWVDGNFKAWRRMRLERRRAAMSEGSPRQGRFVVARETIEAEFRSVGFHILSRQDLLPGYAMWRVYVLRKEA
ncbi:class I SAM-dependent methyltransferase [Pseudomonas boanensis]|uniref:class I SAM-dependent methyltransferase n=1 Tax=Metapseudomonas boanensis TaxID=2822138 RepID=UPI0035D470CB